jgi:hypothetical protein
MDLHNKGEIWVPDYLNRKRSENRQFLDGTKMDQISKLFKINT